MKIGMILKYFWLEIKIEFPQRTQPGTSPVRSEFTIKSNFLFCKSPQNLAKRGYLL